MIYVLCQAYTFIHDMLTASLSNANVFSFEHEKKVIRDIRNKDQALAKKRRKKLVRLLTFNSIKKRTKKIKLEKIKRTKQKVIILLKYGVITTM